MENTIVSRDSIEDMTVFFKVLGDETRLRIVLAIAKEERCVSALSSTLEMTTSAISHQLKYLKYAGLVKSRREGKNVYYSLDDEHVEDIINTALLHTGHIHEEHGPHDEQGRHK